MFNDKACVLCNSNSITPFFETSQYLLKCSHCGIVFDTRTYFDKNYYENDRIPHIDEEKINARKRNVIQRMELIAPFLKKDFSLLDIGCGEGLFLQYVNKFVDSVAGLEPTKIYANYARETLHLDVRQGMIETADFTANSFDFITLFHVLEHLDDPNSALDKIKSWLYQGGFLVIEVPNIESPTARYKGENWELIVPEHRFHFSPQSLRFFLERHGFVVIKEFSRDFDQYRTSIGKNIRKLLFSGRQREITASSKNNSQGNVNRSSNKKPLSLFRKTKKAFGLPLKALMGLIVHKCKRSDYLFLIARKL
jgi:SAM-dependent methyltransferase